MNELEKARKLLELPETATGNEVIGVLAEADAPRRAPFIKAQELDINVDTLAKEAGYSFEMGKQYGSYRTA